MAGQQLLGEDVPGGQVRAGAGDTEPVIGCQPGTDGCQVAGFGAEVEFLAHVVGEAAGECGCPDLAGPVRLLFGASGDPEQDV